MPKMPFQEGSSSFAQPSGLSGDGQWLYVADSEGSSIRAVPFDQEKRVKTLVGTSKLRGGRLFTFGDVDGDAKSARLQHPLGVSWNDKTVYVTDTYNNKIKAVDAESGAVDRLPEPVSVEMLMRLRSLMNRPAFVLVVENSGLLTPIIIPFE